MHCWATTTQLSSSSKEFSHRSTSRFFLCFSHPFPSSSASSSKKHEDMFLTSLSSSLDSVPRLRICFLQCRSDAMGSGGFFCCRVASRILVSCCQNPNLLGCQNAVRMLEAKQWHIFSSAGKQSCHGFSSAGKTKLP